MGIKVEFNPELALRAYRTPGRLEEECTPIALNEGDIHKFLKEGQRNYWLEGDIPLVETRGNGETGKKLADVRILRETHIIRGGKIYTEGEYKINKLSDFLEA